MEWIGVIGVGISPLQRDSCWISCGGEAEHESTGHTRSGWGTYEDHSSVFYSMEWGCTNSPRERVVFQRFILRLVICGETKIRVCCKPKAFTGNVPLRNAIMIIPLLISDSFSTEMNTMNPVVIDVSSDEEDCMGDINAEVGVSESTFPGSDNTGRKDNCLIESVKQELLDQPGDGIDYAKGNVVTINAKKQLQSGVGQSDHRGPMQTTYKDAHEPGSGMPQHYTQSGLCRQFWKAGDYDARSTSKRTIQSGMDHVRVHPKFLHSNATSHKWALGAIAELLDNAVDETQNGATFVSVEKIANPRDNSPALLVQDDGGGMEPDCMRQCMSLGYSRKNTNSTIGQYGNGFKTSTMRLGADVIVFSCCNRTSIPTQSVGLLSYTFLRETGHEDIVVPMVDYETSFAGQRKRLIRSTAEDWSHNLSTLLQWSPYSTEADMLKQFDDIGPHGTKVIVYNLWLNDDGQMELDFESDNEDIQLRGAPKVDKSDALQKQLSQQHVANRLRYSLRAYSSILYLQMPNNFKIFLRGRAVEHHSIADDLKFPEFILYKPQVGGNKEVSVITTIGFTKEAPLVNVHGFNVYHKNRLIMPFWRVFHENSSRGRGVVGVLEANFIEPAHDKQDFERTAVLLRLETRLKLMTIEYWNLHCGLIGYQPSNAKTNKSRSLPGNSSGPPPPIHSTGTYEALRQNVNSSCFPGIGTAAVASTTLSQVACQSNSVPTMVGIHAEERDAFSQNPHMNAGADMAAYVHLDRHVDTKAALLRPSVENQAQLCSQFHNSSNLGMENLTNDAKPYLSRIPPLRGMPPNASESEEAPSGAMNSSLAIPLAKNVNATASAPSTPPQQCSELDDSSRRQFRSQRNGQTTSTREDIHSAPGNVQTEDFDCIPVLPTTEREHQLSNSSLSAMPNGSSSSMPKMKRKILEVQLSESESCKRPALGTADAIANGHYSQTQSISDDGEIGGIPITEQSSVTEDYLVNCREVEELLEENRKLQAQCLEYESKEKELQHRVRELESDLQEVQREYAKLLIESQLLSTVKDES